MMTPPQQKPGREGEALALNTMPGLPVSRGQQPVSTVSRIHDLVRRDSAMDIYNLMKRNGVLEETFSQQNRELELLRAENEKLKQVAAQAENAQQTVEEQVAAINTLSLAALRANRHAENESQKRLREAVRATEEKGKRLEVEMQLEKAKQRQQRLVEGLTEAY